MVFLVVDDDQRVCEGVARRLRAMALPGISAVHVAFSGEAALAFLRAQSVDVLMTDIEMFQVDGLSLIRQAKALRQGLSCVVITAHEEFNYARQAIELEVEDFLLKPIGRQRMRAAVERIIARRTEKKQLVESRLREALIDGLARNAAYDPFIFAQASLSAPRRIRVLAWAGDNPPFERISQWVFPLQARRLALVEASEDGALLEALERLVADTGQALALSDPGLPLADMACQAEQRLDLCWVWKEARVLRDIDTVPADPSFSKRERAVLDAARAVRPEALRSALHPAEIPVQGDAAARMQRLYAATEQALSDAAKTYQRIFPTQSPTMFQGWEGAFGDLIRRMDALAMAAQRQGGLDPAAWACEYLRQHPRQNVDMAWLANHLDLSYSYFSRLFKARTGQAFSQYALRVRMDEAARMLLEGGRVQEVAQSLGYHSSQNFSRVFRQQCGLSPGEFRARRRKAGDIPRQGAKGLST